MDSRILNLAARKEILTQKNNPVGVWLRLLGIHVDSRLFRPVNLKYNASFLYISMTRTDENMTYILGNIITMRFIYYHKSVLDLRERMFHIRLTRSSLDLR